MGEKMVEIKNKKFEEIIMLNVSEKENFNKMLDAVKRLPPFKNIPVTHENVEKMCFRIQEKFPIRVQYIRMFINSTGEHNTFKADIKRTDNHEYLRSIYAISSYELFCKLCIFLYCVGSRLEDY